MSVLARPGGVRLYYETAGNLAGAPALFLHGGPGSGLSGGYRSTFDLRRDFVVGMDQRGCGRSVPLASDPQVLAGLSTQVLIADIEALREHLGLPSWLVVGGSWGTTLALAYALHHPHRVTGLALAAVTTTSRQEVEWITQEMGRVFPREWDQFAAGAHARPDERLVDAYARALRDPDPSVRAAAAAAWCKWEDTHVSLTPGFRPSPRFDDAQFRAVFAAQVTHFWSHDAFLGPHGIADAVSRLAHIPAVLVHGRWDISGPLETAWRLHTSWPASRLVVIGDEGHGGAQMGAALAAAVAQLAAG